MYQPYCSRHAGRGDHAVCFIPWLWDYGRICTDFYFLHQFFSHAKKEERVWPIPCIGYGKEESGKSDCLGVCAGVCSFPPFGNFYRDSVFKGSRACHGFSSERRSRFWFYNQYAVPGSDLKGFRRNFSFNSDKVSDSGFQFQTH